MVTRDEIKSYLGTFYKVIDNIAKNLNLTDLEKTNMNNYDVNAIAILSKTNSKTIVRDTLLCVRKIAEWVTILRYSYNQK